MYRAQLESAEEVGDLHAAYAAVARLVELGLAERYFPNLYVKAAELLGDAGHAEFGAKILAHQARSRDSAAPNVAFQLRRVLTEYAVLFDVPHVAYEAAEEMLRRMPDDPAALTVRLHRLASEGKAADAISASLLRSSLSKERSVATTARVVLVPGNPESARKP